MMKTKLVGSLIVVFCMIAFPLTVHGQDTVPPTDTPESTSTETVSETIASIELNGVKSTTESAIPSLQETPMILESESTSTELAQAETVFDVAEDIVETAKIVETGDPSGILGTAVFGAAAGTPFQYYQADILNPIGCTSTEPVLICFWDSPVQQAIDDAAVGSTITVDGGNYAEELEINKSITLLGIHSPVITAITNLQDDFEVGGVPNRPIIHVTGADGVVIDGFIINGAGQGDANNRFIGIAFHNSSGTIQNNYLEAIRDSSLGSGASGVGIYVLNDDNVSRTVDILGNSITDYQKGGIVASGENLNVNFVDNTITGQGLTQAIDQNGIQISGNAGGIIDSNTILGNWDTSTSGVSSGILVYNNIVPLTISNNSVSENQIDIRVQDSSNVTIAGNTISNSTRGIEIVSITSFGGANATVTGNSITANEWGVYTDNTNTLVTNNSFSGNGLGLVFNNLNQWNYGDILDAPENYWGCPTGPYSGDPNCDLVAGLIMYQPFQPAPGMSLSDYFHRGLVQTNPGLEPELILVSSGQMVDFSCERANIFQLPEGSQVGFSSILCGYAAQIETELLTMDLNILLGGMPLDILPNGATARVSIPIPPGMNGPYAMLYWEISLSGGAGDWVVLPQGPGFLNADGLKKVIAGISVSSGVARVEVNFTGTFVLVGQ